MKALAALLLAVASAVAGAQTTPIAFVGAAVIPMDSERVLRDHTVVVHEGRIVSVGPAAQAAIPAGAQRIDARGKFLAPGLAEMHAHVGGGQDMLERILFLYVANGVTTVRGMLGQPAHLLLRERAARGELVSPTIITSGPSLNGNSAPTPEVAERLVREQNAAGYDLLKIHPGLSRASYDAIVAAARQQGIPFAGHVPADVGLRRALEVRQASVDHLDGYIEELLADGADRTAPSGFFGSNHVARVDERKLPALVTATRAAGVWNVPTQSLMENLFGTASPDQLAAKPEMRYMPAQMVQQWTAQARNLRESPQFSQAQAAQFIQLRQRIIKALHDGGAGLLLGSDAPQVFNVPGFSLHHEMRLMVASGLTPYQVLVAGTRAPAAYFGAAQEFGTIAAGQRADLLLLDANPLEDIGNVAKQAGVMVRGRWLPAGEIRRRLEAVGR